MKSRQLHVRLGRGKPATFHRLARMMNVKYLGVHHKLQWGFYYLHGGVYQLPRQARGVFLEADALRNVFGLVVGDVRGEVCAVTGNS